MSNYRSIAKANALFGGVQIYSILVSIVQSKSIAILLGSEGMGIMGLFSSTIELVNGATNFGIGVSAVRDVSLANNASDKESISRIYSIISKIVWLTGLLGSFVVLLFAKQLSLMTFSSEEYTDSFRFLSVVLIITQLTTANQVMLQGLRQLKSLASNSVIGKTLGLLLIIPLYFIWGIKAIVPAIILSSLISYIVSSYYLRRLNLEKTRLSLIQSLRQGRQMITLGVMLSLTSFMDVVQTYFLKIGISHIGSIADVGLYNAGFALVIGYVGLVFNSIGTDYYPRLTSVCEDECKYNDLINDQMEIMILVLLPIIMLFIAFSKFVIIVLYSEEFLPISIMVNFLAVGMILRAVSWCPGYLYLAKGDKKIYVTIYVITIMVSFILNIFMYYLWGLMGIGIAFVLVYLGGIVITFRIIRNYYNYTLRKQTFIIIMISLLLSCLLLCLSFFPVFYMWPLMSLLITLSIIFSYKELNKRLDILDIAKKRIKRFQGK